MPSMIPYIFVRDQLQTQHLLAGRTTFVLHVDSTKDILQLRTRQTGVNHQGVSRARIVSRVEKKAAKYYEKNVEACPDHRSSSDIFGTLSSQSMGMVARVPDFTSC